MGEPDLNQQSRYPFAEFRRSRFLREGQAEIKRVRKTRRVFAQGYLEKPPIFVTDAPFHLGMSAYY
jgi:hypothetical protein